MPKASASHIGQGMALGAPTAAFVYMYARMPQIAEMILSFHAATVLLDEPLQLSMTASSYQLATRSRKPSSWIPLVDSPKYSMVPSTNIS